MGLIDDSVRREEKVNEGRNGKSGGMIKTRSDKTVYALNHLKTVYGRIRKSRERLA